MRDSQASRIELASMFMAGIRCNVVPVQLDVFFNMAFLNPYGPTLDSTEQGIAKALHLKAPEEGNVGQPMYWGVALTYFF